VTAVLAPFLLLALAACGDPGADPGIATANGGTATPSASSSAAAKGDPVKFADCMREHGVDIEVGQGGAGNGPIKVKGGPGDAAKLDKAQQECRKYAPGGGEGGGQPMSEEDQAKFLKFAQCMRDHGVPMADPEFEGGGVKMRIDGDKGSARIDDGKVEAAQKACESLVPEPPGGAEGGGPGSGPGTGGNSAGGGA
jgi:hypothetical protein